MATTNHFKRLRINLTNRTIQVETVDEALVKKFLGGRGLATKILYDEGVATVDPLSEANKIIFAAGPLTGAAVPTGGRYMVVTKSPLTGMIASSNSGGVWGGKLKYAGWDSVIVEGKAATPVYINIEDEKVEVLPADAYWGMRTEEVDEKLKEAHPHCAVLNIGPAGEKSALLACVMNDVDRAAGRSGVGAVMGSKNLKAITVTATKNALDASNPDELKQTVVECNKLIKANGVAGAGLPTYGTAVLVNIINSIGSLPKRNWQSSYDENAEQISGEAMKEKVLIKNSYCHRCPIGCGRRVSIAGQDKGGPEYEVLWAYGTDCDISDLDAICEANFWCNEYGLDAISTPCTIAAAMELYQRGYIKEEECDGVPLVWGSSKAIVEWTKRMGEGKLPLGKLMAQGSYRLCEHYGHPEYSMSVKKQEMPAYDARGVQGIGITYATSNRGGCHVRGYTIAPEVAGLPTQLDRTATEGKATWAKVFQDLTAVIDSAGMCLFTSFALGAPQYTALINYAIGSNYTVDEIMEVGERIYNIERMFNQQAGMKPEDDRLPKRLTDEPIVDGPSKGEVSHIDVTLPEYYQVRGWVNAFPTEETKLRLGL